MCQIVSTVPGRPKRSRPCPESFCPDSQSEREAADWTLVPSVGERETCNVCVNGYMVSTVPGRPKRFRPCPESFCPDAQSEREAADWILARSVGKRETCNVCVNGYMVSTGPGRPKRSLPCPESFCPVRVNESPGIVLHAALLDHLQSLSCCL